MENNEALIFRKLYNRNDSEFEKMYIEVEDRKGGIHYVNIFNPEFVNVDYRTLKNEYSVEMCRLVIYTILKMHNDSIKKISDKAREEEKADILRFIITEGGEDFEKLSNPS